MVKTAEGDPEFDTKRAGKKLRRYVEDNDHAISKKAEIIVDHFHEQVLGLQKIGGQARAMVVTSSIERAVNYYHAIRDYLAERKSPYQAIVAFSGEHEYGGAKVTEASLNGFSSNAIADRIQEDPYRFLVCADKFQTGYDEPLLHTMYVDKVLSGVKAVQTLSRLNRAHPKKHDAFVLDFTNDADTIRDAFADYYRTTVLADESDPDKLHDLKAALDGRQVYDAAQVGELVELYLSGADRDRLDPILDICVAAYREQLDEGGQVDFKGKAKAFLRAYGFLASILPYTNADWEKLSIFLTFLVPKLPAPVEEDLSKGILEAIDMDSYRVEKQAAQKVQLADEDAEIEPAPTDGGGQKPEPELDRLSNIIRDFNDRFGNIEWKDQDKIEAGHLSGAARQGGRRQGVSERHRQLRQAECADRARQGTATCDDRAHRGPHRAVQAVQRQRLVPQVAARNDVCRDIQSGWRPHPRVGGIARYSSPRLRNAYDLDGTQWLREGCSLSYRFLA